MISSPSLAKKSLLINTLCCLDTVDPLHTSLARRALLLGLETGVLLLLGLLDGAVGARLAGRTRMGVSARRISS